MTKAQEAAARKEVYNKAFSMWLGKYTTAHQGQMHRHGAGELEMKPEWQTVHEVLVSEEQYEMAQAMGDALVRYKDFKEETAVHRFMNRVPVKPPNTYILPAELHTRNETIAEVENDELYEDINIALDSYVNSEITQAELMDRWFDILNQYERRDENRD